MGIFQRLYNLLESACHELDVKLAGLSQSVPTQANEAYKCYVEKLREIEMEKERLAVVLLAVQGYEQMSVELALQNEDLNYAPLVASLQSEAQKLRLEARTLVSAYMHVTTNIHAISYTIFV